MSEPTPEQRVRTDEGVWHPIETAPNDEAIIVAYDDGTVELIQADDNDYTWQPYDKPERGLQKPKYWMIAPEAPQ